MAPADGAGVRSALHPHISHCWFPELKHLPAARGVLRKVCRVCAHLFLA
jgi:hypothetical protein